MQIASAALANSVIMKEFTRVCNPAQSAGGPAPTAFVRYKNDPGLTAFSWPQVPGAVAYVVNRAIDGTTDWKVAGKRAAARTAFDCADLDLISTRCILMMFLEESIPNTTYVYQVQAFGASGEMGWNSTRWTSYAAPDPAWKPAGSSRRDRQFAFIFPVSPGHSASDAADEWKLVGTDGRTWNGTVIRQYFDADYSNGAGVTGRNAHVHRHRHLDPVAGSGAPEGDGELKLAADHHNRDVTQ